MAVFELCPIKARLKRELTNVNICGGKGLTKKLKVNGKMILDLLNLFYVLDVI